MTLHGYGGTSFYKNLGHGYDKDTFSKINNVFKYISFLYQKKIKSNKALKMINFMHFFYLKEWVWYILL